jgi:hypothetical protein
MLLSRLWENFWDWMAGVEAYKDGWNTGYKIGFQLGVKTAHRDLVGQAKKAGIDLFIASDQEEYLALQEKLTRTIH